MPKGTTTQAVKKTQTEASTAPAVPTAPTKLTLLERVRQQSQAKFWNPEKAGDAIDGQIVKIVHGIGHYNSSHYYLTIDGGMQIVSAGETTVLNKKLKGEHLEVGDRLCVIFLGEKTNEKTGKTFKDWEVGSEKAVRPEAGGPPPADDDIPF
jgi:hypothetical protein